MMHRDDETPSPRPRWLGWALMGFMALVVLGMLNLGWRMLQPVSGAGGQGSAASTPFASTGLRLVEASDCLRCHGMERHYVGPSFQQIAARYRDRADAGDYLAGKICNGSVGEWGRTVMPRHPQVTEAQAREMAQWLVSLPVPAVAHPARRPQRLHRRHADGGRNRGNRGKGRDDRWGSGPKVHRQAHIVFRQRHRGRTGVH